MKFKLKTQDQGTTIGDGFAIKGRVKHRHRYTKSKSVTLRTPSIESNHAVVVVATQEEEECDPATGAPSTSRVAGICVSEASIVIGKCGDDEQRAMLSMSEAACQTEFDDGLDNVPLNYDDFEDIGMNLELVQNHSYECNGRRNDTQVKTTPDYCETVATAF